MPLSALIGMASLSLAACGGPDAPDASAVPPTATEPCADTTGAWSSTVDGLRGRLLTSHDGSTLHVSLELENTSGAPLAIYWSGRADTGFATFILEDESGAEIPEPDWRFGGNEPAGDVFEVLLPNTVVRHQVPLDIVDFSGAPAVRIGAFWGRELPPHGSRAALRAQVSGSDPSHLEEPAYVERSDDGSVLARQPSPSDPQARPWTEALDLPAICIQ